jgi:hypothetical protein
MMKLTRLNAETVSRFQHRRTLEAPGRARRRSTRTLFRFPGAFRGNRIRAVAADRDIVNAVATSGRGPFLPIINYRALIALAGEVVIIQSRLIPSSPTRGIGCSPAQPLLHGEGYGTSGQALQ